MSQMMQLLQAISAETRKIDDQLMKLRGYGGQIDKSISTVESVLGSDDEYGKKMLDQLARTKKQVEDTSGYLQNAKDKLGQVGIRR